jgi:hypothetical protein
VGLFAMVVRKGSNFDPLLCGLSPPVSAGRPLVLRYTVCGEPVAIGESGVEILTPVRKRNVEQDTHKE